MEVTEKRLGELLEKINEAGLNSEFTRYRPDNPIDFEYSFGVITGIGKKKSPKFVIDDDNRFLYENLIRWIHCDKGMRCINPMTGQIVSGNLMKGIYISGTTGTGKSWAIDIMGVYAFLIRSGIKFNNTESYLYWKGYRADTICDEYKNTGIFEGYKNRNILAIQDLGSEPKETMYMGNRENVMRAILEHRGDFMEKITLITSNIPMRKPNEGKSAIADLYGDRVESRLYEMCNYFEIRGIDRRKI